MAVCFATAIGSLGMTHFIPWNQCFFGSESGGKEGSSASLAQDWFSLALVHQGLAPTMEPQFTSLLS